MQRQRGRVEEQGERERGAPQTALWWHNHSFRLIKSTTPRCAALRFLPVVPSIGNVLTQLQLKKFQCQPHSPVASHCRHSIFNRHSKFAATDRNEMFAMCFQLRGIYQSSRAARAGRPAGRGASSIREHANWQENPTPVSVSVSLCVPGHININVHHLLPSLSAGRSVCLPLWPLLAQRRHCCLLVKVLCQRLSHNIN